MSRQRQKCQWEMWYEKVRGDLSGLSDPFGELCGERVNERMV